MQEITSETIKKYKKALTKAAERAVAEGDLSDYAIYIRELNSKLNKDDNPDKEFPAPH